MRVGVSGIVLLTILFAIVSPASQVPTVTLVVFPGTEETAVGLQVRLAAHNIDVKLICSFFSVQLVAFLGSTCEQSVAFAQLAFVALEEDFLVLRAYTSGDLQVLQGVLNQIALEGGAVGVGQMYKVHAVTIPDTEIRSLRDLDEESHATRTSTGPKDSTHEAHAHDVFQAEELFRVLNRHQHRQLALQPDLLLAGKLDAFFETTKVPSPYVKKVAERNELVLLAIPQDTVERMNDLKEEGEAPYIPTEIDPAKYEEEGEGPVATAGVTEVAAATGRPAPELVELVTRILIEESFMSREDLARALQWLKEQEIPLHPVAAPIIDDVLR